MKLVNALANGLFMATFCCFFSVQAQLTIEVEQEIDALFQEYDNADSPGASVAIVSEGKRIYSKGFGSANLEYGVPITSETIFHTASLSKQFTAFAILLLADEGKLSMKDDIRKYIPELPVFASTISLEKLACHSSGLRDQWRLLEMAGWQLDDVISTENILDLLNRQNDLNFEPGKKNIYSNSGFTLLAEVVERVSGQSFSEFTEERIFKPLGMHDTQFCDDYQQIIPNRAYSYFPKDSSFEKGVLSYATVGPTGLMSTANDFTLWAMNFKTMVVGNDSIFKQLNSVPKLNDDSERGYALGQIRGTYQGLNVFVHSGSDAGFRSYFVRLPDHDLSVVVFANSSEIEPINLVFGIVNLFVSEHFIEPEPRSNSYFEHDESTFITLSNEVLKGFEGTYFQPNEGYERILEIQNDTLAYVRPEGSTSKLVPIASNRFKMLNDTEDVTVVFSENAKGQMLLNFYINDDEPKTSYTYAEVTLSDYTGLFYSEELQVNYKLEVKNDELLLSHPRLGEIQLDPIQSNVFNSQNRNFKLLEFVRNSEGEIESFQVSNDGVVNLSFQKVME